MMAPFSIEEASTKSGAVQLMDCRSEARSGRARETLVQIGYDNVTNGGGIGSLSLRLNRAMTIRR